MGGQHDSDGARISGDGETMAASSNIGTSATHTPGVSGGGSESDLAPGTRVGEYEVEAVIGRGGFGTVYRAVQPLIGKRVAVKVLSRKYSADGEIVSRFIAEAKVVNQIRHRHIIDIFSFGQLPDGRHYYVMEHLDGEPLDRYLAERGPMRVDEALPILRSIARALDAAHAKGIAHRDLKPENIFLARSTDGDVTELWPKLLDFGIAKLGADDTLAHKTGTGVPIGTPYYMSPEQCRGRDVDYRTDIYSFGVLTYRLLTGTYPFEGDVIDILHKQMHEDPDPPSQRNAALSHEADQAVLWMMQKEPDQRPRTVIAAVVALQDDKTPTPMLTPRQLQSALVQRGAVAADTTDLETPRPSRRWLLPVAALVVIGGAAGAFWVTRRVASTPPPVTPVVERAPQVTPPPPTPDAAAVDAAAVEAASFVTLRVTSAPDGTQVMYAGTVIGVTPTPIQIKRGSDPVTLVFQEDAHVAMSKQIVPDKDQDVDVKLKKKPRATRPTENGDSLADPFKRKQ